MKRTLRRIASWLCVLSLCLSLLPGTAWAADPSLIEETPPVTEQSGCICNAANGVHTEDCPLYKGSESVDEPECTCETVDGVHAEDCPLYEVPESEEPACTCEVVDGIHAEDCPLYVAPDPIEEESETVLTELQDRINALPEVAELEDMDEDELDAVYLETCGIWDEIDLLSEEEAAALDTAKLEALSEYFAAPAPQPEGNYTITPGMSQEQVDTAVDSATGTITIQAGNYGIEGEKNHIKINLKKGNQTVQLEENDKYNRLMFVVLSDGNTLEANGATIYGDVSTVYNQSPAIYIPYGSLELEGNLTIDDHDYGVILGFTNGTAEHESVLTLAESAELNIVNCKKISDVGGDSSYDGGIVCRDTDYFSYVDTQGDGTRGSGITTKGQGNTRAKVVVSPNAELSVTYNSGAGIFSVNADNFTLDIQPGAEVDLSGNGQGICMNTDYTGSVDVNVDNAALTITDNSSNGITGQSLPYLLDIKNDSTVTVDNNGGIGINNFFIQVSDSYLSVSNSGSHGATNVALDAVDSTVETSGNTYRGLNITKGNVKADLGPDLNPAVTLISNSTIIAEENKQSGIYFINSAGTLIENSSTIETSGNGITSPGSTFSGAGIVGSYDVTVADSTINSEDPHSFSVSHTSTSPAVWYVKENVVAVAQGTVEQNGQDIVDDYNSGHGPESEDPYLGEVVITGGSLDASIDITYEDYQTYLDDSEGWTYEDVTNTVSLVNDRDEDLFRFHLNSELNTVVGGSGERSFSYPYQEGAGELTYQFVYDESGDAYVWTPVTVVQYDATEGEIDTLGTAVSVEDAVVDAGDITIYGNSLALAERQLPTASKEGAVFSGWYYAVGEADIAQAAEYAANEEYAALYELLLARGRVLDADTLTSDDSYDVENITVYAVWEQGSLTVTKYVATRDISPDQTFDILVSYGGNTRTIQLKNGESHTFTNIPVGTAYTVTEASVNGYTPTYVACEGIITSENLAAAATVLNVPVGEGALAISKTVNGGDLTREFTFTVEFNASGTYDYTGSKTGEIASGGTITLKNGESISINNLPEGTTYTVTETAVEGYTTTISGDDADMRSTINGNVASGMIVAGGAAVAHYTNTYTPEVSGVVAITPADITVYTGGESYEGVVDEGGTIDAGDGLPEPGYLITLPDDVNNKYFGGNAEAQDLSGRVRFVYDGNNDGTYEGNTDRIWDLDRYSEIGTSTTSPEDGIARYVYKLQPDSITGTPVRLKIYEGDDPNDFIISDDFLTTVENLYETYNMTIYSGGLNQGEIRAEVLIEGDWVPFEIDIGIAELTIRGTTNEEHIVNVGSGIDSVTENTTVIDRETGCTITAVAPVEGTQYYINESLVSVDPANVSLLSDDVVDTDPLYSYIVENDLADNGSNYLYRYLDLVDHTNGRAWVTSTEPIDVYWKIPNDASRNDDFQIIHFEGLDREYDDLDNQLAENEPVVYSTRNGLLEIVQLNDGEWYLKFATDSFSPFVLIWGDDNGGDRPRPDPDPDDDKDNDKDDEEPEEDLSGLNTTDHYAYIAGYEDGTVRPDGNITRAEVATIFFRLMTDEYRETCWSTSSGFTDVTAANWYNNAISTTANAGWVSGYPDGTFRPDAYITRAEFATIAARFLSDVYGGTSMFTDISGHWAEDYINRAAAAGWINGYADGTFRPNAYITRAEAVTLINRMLDRAPDANHLLADMVRWPDNPETAWYYADIQEATNSHDYTRAGTGNYEVWTELLANRDWAALEEIWSQANDAPGGEVMG